MARASQSRVEYSRLVWVLKVTLPLVALVLLSLVFLLARTIDPTAAVRTASIDVQDRARDPRLSGARFAGVTDDGAALTILSETARSDPNGALRLSVTGLDLRIEHDDGLSIAAHANSGTIDRDMGLFEMTGGLTLHSGNSAAGLGYTLHTDSLIGALDATRLRAPTGVSGQAPAGEIRAGSLELRPSETTPGGYVLVFRDGVRLNYAPEE